MVFWLAVTLLLVLVLSFIWLPYLSNYHQLSSINWRQQTNIALYRQQITLAEDQFAGQNPVLLAQFKDEMALNLLRDSTVATEIKVPCENYSLWLPLLMSVAISVIVVISYASFGRYQSAINYAEQLVLQDPFADMDIQQIKDQQIIELQDRIRQSPQQAEIWFSLGQLYLYDNQFDNALAAFDKVISLQQGIKAETLAAKATVLYYQANQKITPAVQILLDQTFVLAPLQITATMLLAADHFNQARYQRAIDLWQSLLDSGNPQVNRPALIESINMAKMVNHH